MGELKESKQFCYRMNKLLLVTGLLVALVAVTANAQKKGNNPLNKICVKCDYCKTDQNCDGCAKCGECTSRSQRGCRFCKEGEDESGCRERCQKGCKICERLESCKNKGK